MQRKQHGINDSDKVLVTVALWIAAIAVFAVAFTLPMLPDRVTTFYKPANDATPEFYSKYNNLLIILVSLIPAAVMIIAALLKNRGRLQNSFLSITLFSIILSLCMSSVSIYGIIEQFDSSSRIMFINVHGLTCTVILFALSLLSALMPMIVHSEKCRGKVQNGVGFGYKLLRAAEKYWYIGAYGYIFGAIACAFVPGMFSYISLAVFVVAHFVPLVVIAGKGAADRGEKDKREITTEQ